MLVWFFVDVGQKVNAISGYNESVAAYENAIINVCGDVKSEANSSIKVHCQVRHEIKRFGLIGHVITLLVFS